MSIQPNFPFSSSKTPTPRVNVPAQVVFVSCSRLYDFLSSETTPHSFIAGNYLIYYWSSRARINFVHPEGLELGRWTFFGLLFTAALFNILGLANRFL